jgi:predicted MPP superfamily phosphohydrolase
MEQEAVTSRHALIEDTSVDVMAARPLHKIMVFLDKPAQWSNLRSGLTMILLAVVPSITWRFFTASQDVALLVGSMLLLFFLGDLLILSILPRRRISYGAWQPQLFQLAALRTMAALGIGFVAFFAGWQLALLLLIAVQILGTFALYWGALVEPARVKTTKLLISSDRLQPDAGPIRLLHISDLHIEHLSRREDDVLRAIEVEKPDFIVFTGDYVSLSNNRDSETYRRIHNYLAQMSAPFGVYATLGTPTVDIRDYVVPMFDDMSINLLRSECQVITLANGQTVALLGIDCTHHLKPDASVLKRVVQQAPPGVTQVFLYHSPELMPQAVEEKIDLYLCGHTHGGQVRLPLIGPLLTSSQLGRKYVMGLYKEGRTHLYVSRGLGLEGLSAPRVRFLTRPEITLVTIKPA